MGVAWLPALLLIVLAVLPHQVWAGKFKCPAFTKLTTDAFIFPDPAQCDKYWTCIKGDSRRSLCPDGLVFHPGKVRGEEPCDHRHNVPDKCRGRVGRQNPKPGDGHCPRQNGVYPSDDPYECDVYYSCLNGKSSPTKCARGLHYSDVIGTCVWPRESGRTDCAVAGEKPGGGRRRKKGGAGQSEQEQPLREVAKALSNGFTCPGGPLGVHPALPHPDNCQLYYVCLNGLTPSDAGCIKGKVFNPTSQQCDLPGNVEGCEYYYNPAAKQKKAEIATSLGADLDSSDFSKFIKLLKMSGVLKGNIVSDSFRSLGGGQRFKGRREGGGRRPGHRRQRPKLRRQRPLRVQRPKFDSYSYDYDYLDVQSPESPAESRSFAQSPRSGDFGRQPIAAQPRHDDLLDAVRVTPITSKPEEVSARRGEPPSVRGLFAVPANRKNRFTSKFIPRVKMVGNTENLAPVPTLVSLQQEEVEQLPAIGPEQPAQVPVVPHLSGSEADSLFNSLFPSLEESSSPTAVLPHLPEPALLVLVEKEEMKEPPLRPVILPRSRASLFSRRPKQPVSVSPARQEPLSTEVRGQEARNIGRAGGWGAGNLVTSTQTSVFVTQPNFHPVREEEQTETVRRPVTTERPDTTRRPVTTRRPLTTSRRPLTTSRTEVPRMSSLFTLRNRLRSRTSVRQSVREETTSTNVHRFSPTPIPVEVTTVNRPQSIEPVVQQTSPVIPFIQRKAFRSFLKSRTRVASASTTRQAVTIGPVQTKPVPEIPASHSPVSTQPTLPTAQHAPVRQTFPPLLPTLPHPSPAQPRFLDLARPDFFPTPHPTTPAPERRVVPAFLEVQQPEVDLAIQITEIPFPLPSRERIPLHSVPSRERVPLPFRERIPHHEIPSPVSSLERIPLREVPSPVATRERIPFPDIAAPTQPTLHAISSQSFRERNQAPPPLIFLVTAPVSRGRFPSTEPVLHSVPRRPTEKHMVVMKARSQLKPYLPEAENEGDALEKLRAKIERLQNTNRHRGRG